MPKGYEEIKASLRKQHPEYTNAELKEHAARIWNSQHPDNPVGRGEHHKKTSHKKKGRK